MGQKDPATLVDKIAGISYNVDRQVAGYERPYRLKLKTMEPPCRANCAAVRIIRYSYDWLP